MDFMKTSKVLTLLLSAAFLLSIPVCCVAQAPTPPMGWNSWNHFGLGGHPPTAKMIEAQADAMVQSGMQAVGYTYVNIDDEWQAAQRDVQGNILPNPVNFPDGMAPVAEYVHNLGLKIGIYSSPGKLTCSGHIGSYGHEQQDANTFASWGMDYLKYDWCTATGNKPAVFGLMATALHKTGRTFVYSIVDYGNQEVWQWASSSGANLWRTGPDVKDDFYTMAETGFGNDGLESFAGPGKGWNDADMLQVGNGGMTVPEYQIQMSLWSIMAAPLIAGNDLTQLLNQKDNLQQQYLALLTNPNIIAVDQDSLGAQGYRVWQQGPQEIWKKPMADGSTVVGVFNRVIGNAIVALPFQDIGITGTVNAINLWTGKHLGNIHDGYKVTVAGMDAVMIKLTPAK
jgi:alpha-galactosidase